MPGPYLGGSFAPPITSDHLADYRALAESADPQVKDAMVALCDMVDLFQQTPASKKPGRKHQAGVGLVVPLEDAEVARIWDVVPWGDELDAYAARFEGVQAAEASRNAAKISAWRQAVIDRVCADHSVDREKYAEVIRVIKSQTKMRVFFESDEQFENFQKRVAEAERKITAWQVELNEALVAKSHPAVPFPRLESTSLRDAAHHLLWMGKELALDREPICTDKLT